MIKGRPSRHPVVLLAVVSLAACTTKAPLPSGMYEGNDAIDFDGLPPALRSTTVDLLYVTDRAPETDGNGATRYGFERSQSLAYGSVLVKLDDSMSWEEVVDWTRGKAPDVGPPAPKVISTTELGRFPDTPFPVELDEQGQIVRSRVIEAEHSIVQADAIKELERRMALTKRKTVWLSVHGVQTSFEEGAQVMALTWHQRGRVGVPIYYSWPAGASGVLTGYSYDRESGEFTIYHLKQFLRALGNVPGIERVNLFAHSRGTDVLLSALRELMIESWARGESPRVRYNFGDLVLLAPDMDVEVATQRILAEGIGRGVEHTTVYVSEDDWAIGLARSLFGSRKRIGQINPEDLTPEQQALFERVSDVDIIFYRGKGGGVFGHSYYETPEVLSDIVLLGQGRRAGSEFGRPLEPVGPHLWIIGDGYKP